MEGENTGPINIGNPGYIPYCVSSKNIMVQRMEQLYSVISFYFYLPGNLGNFFIFLGEFTMLELAETVKEVSYC